ncbi:putative superfamily III holin-X [Jatrophihabitans sp. GAS493]|uniref:phage holin family protein n=1 Tax=Jatrophihabitans sp. GAS493 TaxID=1907575 RepID=UPI000BB90B7F|nr:phage holin family protein [Jatrophihabitans sp. GAS493]SOD71897.1 putative superfamily III holin-X [Jatrophihabitans sp. GAS493]
MSTESSHPSPKHSTATAAPTAAGNPVPAPQAPALDPDASIGRLVHGATMDISTLIRGEVELAKLELRASIKSGGVGVVFFILAGVLFLYALTFAFISAAEGLTNVVPRWLAYLIVFLAIFVVAVVIAFIGYRMVKKVRAPTRTIETTKDTVAYLRHPTQAS